VVAGLGGGIRIFLWGQVFWVGFVRAVAVWGGILGRRT